MYGSERSRAPKVTYYMLQLHEMTNIGESQEVTNRFVFYKGQIEKWKGYDCFRGTEFPIGALKTF